MTQHLCLTCGGALINESGAWSCKYCGNVYEDESVQRDADMMRALLDEVKTEQVANLRRNLYDAINAKYIDSEQICNICARIKEYLPDDFMANFYYVANSGSHKEVAEYITYINVEDNLVYIEGILKFLLRSFCSEYHLPIAGVIERAYRHTDLEKFERYNTLLSEEAEKENLGVYETRMPRDVFVAYSSKDMESVYSLVAYLEASGLKCFVAARNLRHGQGAKQNYDSAIREAVMNCESVVFVSSPNSRTFSCEAVSKELPFIKQCDINNAPYEYKQNYANMPYTYKMPRVEYRIAESRTPNAADSVVKEFFENCEFAYTPEEVGTRIIHLLEEKKNRHLNIEKTVAAPEVTEKKYCADCGTENPISSKFCGECGGREFVASRAAFEELKTRKKLAEQEKLEREAQQRKLAEQQRQIDEVRRKAEEERKKAEAERRKAEAERKKAAEEKQRQSNQYSSQTRTTSGSYSAPRSTSGTSGSSYSAPRSTSGTSGSSYSPSQTSGSYSPSYSPSYTPPKKKSGGVKKFFITVIILGIISTVFNLVISNAGIKSKDPSNPENTADIITELVGTPISTAEELKALTDSKGDFYLSEDIDLEGVEWTPIQRFEGTINGNGHTIRNLKITKGTDSIGLFADLTGKAMNLTIEDAEITLSDSGNNVGILCGMSGGSLSNITVSGKIDAPSFENVGGIAGIVYNTNGDEKIDMSNLQNLADVHGEANVGGIIGRYERNTTWYIENNIKNITNEGTVSAKKNNVGGVFGSIDTDLGYLYISEVHNKGSVEGAEYVGGIVGHAETELIASYIKDSSNSGSVKAEAVCGGIAGELINVHIEGCSNEYSSIEATGYIMLDGKKFAMVGGLVGKGTYATECTNMVDINYEGDGSCVGGIIGYSQFACDIEIQAKNLKNNGSITGASYVGGIYGYYQNDCGWYRSSYFNSFENNGNITGNGDYVGGVFGCVDAEQGYIYIDSAKNAGSITGTTYVGGIVGHGISQLPECYIQNSSSSANISAEAICGSIAGQLDLIFIKDCSNDDSSIEANGYVLEKGDKNAYVGGFVGKGFYASNCTNKVDINYTSGGSYVGGIIGCVNYKADVDPKIENLENEANINGASYVGGIIGGYYHDSGWYHVNQFDVITNNGSVTGSGDYVGGCIGHIDVTLGYLYVDSATNSGSVSGKTNCGDLIGYATAETDESYISGSTTAGGNLCGKTEGVTIK